ncbi:hypothetical protein WMY93_000023 [Mugilogobius chulae]|uniref:Uncharacterized protein n=1 Tax=Mugilogobius chulae TaxID=88201 RepID=A0AAW0Q1C2_9GOBI
MYHSLRNTGTQWRTLWKTAEQYLRVRPVPTGDRSTYSSSLQSRVPTEFSRYLQELAAVPTGSEFRFRSTYRSSADQSTYRSSEDTYRSSAGVVPTEFSRVPQEFSRVPTGSEVPTGSAEYLQWSVQYLQSSAEYLQEFSRV